MSETELENIKKSENDNLYIINIEKFNGPLDVLWELIKKSKIDITEISLSEITEQYISFIKMVEDMDVRIASDFILMASELIYYKSRVLLPSGEVEDEYFTQPLPPELIQKLLEYKKYQKVSETLKNMYDVQNNAFIRKNSEEGIGEEEYYLEVSLYELLKAFSNVLNSNITVDTKEIIFDEILVSDRIEFITEMLKEREFILFQELFSDKTSRAEIISTFLAVLEMSKTTIIRVQQHRIFGDIRILRNFSLDRLDV